MKSFSQIAFFLLLSAGARLASGFAPVAQQRVGIQQDAPSSQLFSSITSIETTEPTVSLDLPKNALPFRQDKEKVEKLLDVEVAIGRIAMVAALVFFGVEVTTDTSIPEQIAISLGMLA